MTETGVVSGDRAVSDDGTVPCLSCANCGLPLCTSEDILPEPHPTLNDACYRYRIDLLDRPDVCCYSTTNPESVRFDVVRVATERLSSRLSVYGVPTSDYSWFPPSLWSMAECGQCASHLGWAFHLPPSATGPVSESPDSASTDGDESSPGSASRGVVDDASGPEAKPFLGLIVTRLRERQCPAASLDGGGALDMDSGPRRSRTTVLLRRLRDNFGSRTRDVVGESEGDTDDDGSSDSSNSPVGAEDDSLDNRGAG